MLGPGMTVLTGETGAGKTLIVDAIALLLGGRADAVLVRPGAAEAVVEGRFVGVRRRTTELVLTRVVPATGRARAYVDGRMASAPAAGRARRPPRRPPRPARPPVAAAPGRPAGRPRLPAAASTTAERGPRPGAGCGT